MANILVKSLACSFIKYNLKFQRVVNFEVEISREPATVTGFAESAEL